MVAERSTDTTGGTLLGGARRLAAAVGAGALAGVLVGGIGGRIAMLVLRLTSDPGLHGSLTDDGFTIGVVSNGTMFLLVLTTILGSLGGVLYLLVRPWLPVRARAWVFAALGGVVGGSNIIRPGGIDFTLLDPLPLAVAMFVAIPAIGAGVTSVFAERFLRDGSRFHRSWAALALLLPVLLATPILLLRGPTGLVIAVAIGTAVVAVIANRGPVLARLWRSTPVTWVGRALLATFGAIAAVRLVSDVVEIL